VADAELDPLLGRPAIIDAVRDLGLTALGLEDVLAALSSFGSVRIDVTAHAARPYTCALETPDGQEHGRGTTVLVAAIACWADALDAVGHYSRRGVAELEQFLLDGA
jgi:hypothetical protein